MTKKHAEKPEEKSEDVKPDEPKGECYMDGTPAAVGDLCLFQSTFGYKRIMREGILVHIAKGAGQMDGIVAYAECENLHPDSETVIVTTETAHVTIAKCMKSGLESEF